FDSAGKIRAIPVSAANDYFHFGQHLAGGNLNWALIDHTPGHLEQWERNLKLSGNIRPMGAGLYLLIPATDSPSDAETFLRRARTSDPPLPPPPLTSFSQQITSPEHQFIAKAGKTHIVEITVQNTGTQPWPAGGSSNWVDAGYEWLDRHGKVLPMVTDRAHLTRAVIVPGESDSLKLLVVAPKDPGLYKLRISMVQEGVAWFFTQGAKPLILHVTVKRQNF
ncbi:MAG: hypothetical protein ACREBW_08075, partial [Candidatus Micrarchaeaceae archaeon]